MRALPQIARMLARLLLDPRLPRPAKVALVALAFYLASPIDLIPDVIPVLGYLDDLVLVPLGILAARRMIPVAVLGDCRERARAVMAQGRPTSRTAAVVVVVIWVAAAVLTIRWLVP